MIARSMEVIDIAPEGYGNFRRVLERIATGRPRAVLWHEDGVAQRLVLDGERVEFGARAVRDARDSARELHGRLGGRARRVIVTDRPSWLGMYETLNMTPSQDEPKYDYHHRLNQALMELNSPTFAVYPELSLDRGPVGFNAVESYFRRHSEQPVHVVLAVFDRDGLYFSFVVRMYNGVATRVTSFDHWPGMIQEAGMRGESLDTVVERVEQTEGAVACGLFMARDDFERLFDGRVHDSLPGSLIVGGQAFGISHLPGVPDVAFLNTAALFAYVPLLVD